MIQIENTPVERFHTGNAESESFHAFVRAMAKLQPGQSFVVENPTSSYRLAMTILATALERQFISRKVEPKSKSIRFGRAA